MRPGVLEVLGLISLPRQAQPCREEGDAVACLARLGPDKEGATFWDLMLYRGSSQPPGSCFQPLPELMVAVGHSGRGQLLGSTFSLTLPAPVRRLVTLISQQATLLASNEAFKKQVESGSEAAKKYMENDQLKKVTAVDGGKLDVGNAEVKLEEENRSLKAELRKLKDELASTKQKLEKAENQVLAMRKQSEGLTKEYDCLLEEHAKLQATVDGPMDKKKE
ncbi:B-cell receptor-associated protein 31-like [Gorilla gorilla gorilla]|uniref:B-cell receptor-associated protein 31-like n=1 Tax=Gorilla gorilla gorilla TaxID=9595 RepID=UPI00123E7FAC|nr:B-cell receptor-associated protein 31-like [Gorilla gorilla gorilla]